MNEVAADLSRWQWLTLRLSMRRNRWHEYRPDLCEDIMQVGPTIVRRSWSDPDWCDCLSPAKREERRLWASMY